MASSSVSHLAGRFDQYITPLLDAFSYPQAKYELLLDELVPVIVREYASGLTAAYLERHASEISQASDGLLAHLAGWIAHMNDSSSKAVEQPLLGWDYCFGDVYRAMHSDAGEHTQVAASIGAHLSAAGHPGAWRVRVDEPFRLRWGDWLLPPSYDVTVTSNGTTARVDFTDDGEPTFVNFFIANHRWEVDCTHKVNGLRRLLRIDEHGVSVSLLVKDALSMRDYEDLLSRALPEVDQCMCDVFADALDLLAEYAPEYLPWIARTVHQLFLLRPKPSKVESGSVEHYLGLMHLTAHGEPLPVAELLLHEASHQYMNVASKLLPIDDGTDLRRYWSPAVETERPISKIVAAFHAFGNVLLFYRRCAKRGLPNLQECYRQEKLLNGWMTDLVPPIRDNPSLTAVGNGLCHSLLQELRL